MKPGDRLRVRRGKGVEWQVIGVDAGRVRVSGDGITAWMDLKEIERSYRVLPGGGLAGLRREGRFWVRTDAARASKVTR